MIDTNETHDQKLKSWVESANETDSDFPIQNLPYCYFDRSPADGIGGVGVAIGDYILDLARCREDGLLGGEELDEISWTVAKSWSMSELLGAGKKLNSTLRQRVQEILREGADDATKEIARSALLPVSRAIFDVPCEIRDYTDFYCSIYHATNVGSIFRPDNPLLPNYKYIPIGYHGRASSIVISGTDITRPKGQNRGDTEKPPVYIPSKALDYEMEVGFFISKGNEMGNTISIKDVEEHIFGLCLVNDWSSRDIQGWEAQPLGPFLGKSFATTISPFVVTMEALAPFRVPTYERPEGDPEPLEYLANENNERRGGIDLKAEVFIQTKNMRDENIEPHLLSRSNMKDLYWTIGQMVTHHASNGCNLQIGDLMATGTVSGSEDDARGCLLEITKRGKEPIELPSGETRRFLEDYDEIIMKGFCEREGFRRIGFGECRGIVLPAE